MLVIAHILDALDSVIPSYDVRAAYLFGSFARGDISSQSDIDLRLECAPFINYADLLYIQENLEELIGRQIELITNPLEYMRPAFRRRVQQNELLLYETA